MSTSKPLNEYPIIEIKYMLYEMWMDNAREEGRSEANTRWIKKLLELGYTPEQLTQDFECTLWEIHVAQKEMREEADE